MIKRILKGLGPLAVLAMGAGLSGCGSVDVTINGEEGVPLSELDMSGAAPEELVVSAGPRVIVTEGDTLDITVEEDPEDALRFVLDDEVLGITVDKNADIRGTDTIVRVTMPAPRSVVVAGSGKVEAAAVSSSPELVIGGSGSISIAEIAADTLEVTIGGAGSVDGAGTAERLEVTIGGSGSVDFAELTADRAEISIGGSGDVAFASDGEVEASIAGSGDINVVGDAKCTVSAIGSGTLNCSPRSSSDEAESVTAE